MFEPISSTVPAEPVELPQDWFFTFGAGQEHDGGYVRIYGTQAGARAAMVEAFGTAWSFQYRTAERAGVEEFGLFEVAMPAAPNPCPGGLWCRCATSTPCRPASTLDGGQ